MKQCFEIVDYVTAGMLARHKTWRAGQGFFNALNLVRPDLADEIRGKDLDPFYDNKKMKDAVQWFKAQLSRESVEETLSNPMKDEL